MKHSIGILLLAALLLVSGCAKRADAAPAPTPDQPREAGESAMAPQPEGERLYVFLGVEGYGAVDAAQRDAFRYRFFSDGETLTCSVAPDGGAYAVQNLLEEGRVYALSMDGDTIVGARECATLSGTVEQTDADAVVIAGQRVTFDRVWRCAVRAGGAEVTTAAPQSGETVAAVLDETTRALYVCPAASVYVPPVSGTPGVRTLKNFLQTALMPVGTTLYVYGGGWNWQDTASGTQASSIGLPAEWVTFFQTQNAAYTYKAPDAAHSFYPFGGWNEYYFAGADCSGYVGWALYNTFETTDGAPGYVDYADRIASNLAARGWGSVGQNASVVLPGDIMSMSGHVWIALGSCADGSIVIAHSTPSPSLSGSSGGGVQLGAIGTGTACEAYRLAEQYMHRYYPVWTARYAVTLQSPGSYLSGTRFTWDTAAGLSDPEGIRQLQASEVLALLFAET